MDPWRARRVSARRRPRALVAAVALGAAVAWLAGSAPAQPKRDAAAEQQRDSERTLQQKQRQLKEEKQKAADARRREAGVLAELEATEKRLEQKRAQVAALDQRVRRAQAEIVGLRDELRRLEIQRRGQEEAMGKRLRLLYRIEREGGVLPLLLAGGSDDTIDRAVRLRHLATLATVDARTIREYRVTLDGLAERKARLETRRTEIAGMRAEVEDERAEADREAARRRVLLAKVRDERVYHDRMVGELSEATRRLEAFIRDLQAKQRVAKAPAPSTAPRAARPAPSETPTGPGLGAHRGRLAWPAEGRVVASFGAMVHPRFGTKTFRNGIDIAVSEGASFTAVATGHVVYAGWFRGYGNLVILDHGFEYFTLYAHAADIRVGEGDEVKQGQVLGTIGDTGSLAGGPRLYFEVRHQGKPQDPADWLRPRG